MTQFTEGFSGFSVRDTDAAAAFYRDVLGLEVAENEMGILTITLPGGAPVLAYPKGDDHVPATFTVLNFVVPDIDVAVDELTAAGVTFERYEGMPQDEKGIGRGKAAGRGPDIAWFTDPSGNIIAVMA
ncbi:VOC family protein [Herbiconiux sp. KACC 21604]|uniref:VOC family protein n=1 Tax=unclassified Herbiconiux TaxID=2618217 RepID=UPI0014909617|nr:VOC family protein [Herbiconiux sp. SALV-R1]QJU53213.1 VOC family protein [Herbiconiux sp. SALV-R1]WPO88163.1 VOC family protein [Herbiconiux sp. KACC 21604]